MKKNYLRKKLTSKSFKSNFIKILLAVLLLTITAYLFENFQFYTKYPFVSAYINIKPQPSILPEFKILPTKNWKKFTTSDGSMSFVYPPYSKIKKLETSIGARIEFDIDDAATPTGMQINISKYDSNIYNRPFDKFYAESIFGFRDGRAFEVIYVKNIPFKLLYAEDELVASTVIGTAQYSINLNRSAQVFDFENEVHLYRKYLPEFLTILNSLTIDHPENTDKVFIDDGDVAVRTQASVQHLTNTHTNIHPVVSPNGNRIVYLSQTQGTIEKTKGKFSPYSDYSFVIKAIQIDGTNEVQISGSDDEVSREILKWKDNDTIIYRDGDKSIKVYSFTTNESKTIAGPEQPEGDCFSGSSYCYSYFLSPDASKYIIFKGGMGTEQVIRIVDLDTLKVQDLHKQFRAQDCYYDRYYQDQTLFTFMCSKARRAPDGEKTPHVPANLSNIQYNLKTDELKILPYNDKNL